MEKGKKLILSVIAIVVIVCGCIFMMNGKSSKADGSIEVVLVDLEGTTVADKNIDFMTGDTLVDLLDQNFENVVVDNGMLMTIEDFTTPEDWSSFICIYVDDEMSEVGIMDIEVKDGEKISFVMTEFNADF